MEPKSNGSALTAASATSRRSPSDQGSDSWNGSDHSCKDEAPFGSPRSVTSTTSSGVSTDHSDHPQLKHSPPPCKRSHDGTGRYSPSAQMAQFHIGNQRTPSNTQGFYILEQQAVVQKPMTNGAAHHHNHSHKVRRVDSPTDSGIESSKEHCNGSTPTTSVCSSPRSAMDDKVKEVASDSEGSDKHENIEDMPVLKRALQAPPLINTNMLMDEAYRHHKKLRAARNGEQVASTTSTPPATEVNSKTCNNTHSSSLLSSHSTLLKTLESPSRYMNEQQLKRTDLIHTIIMKTESQQQQQSSTPHNQCPVSEANGQMNGWASKLAIAPVGRAVNVLGGNVKGIQSGFYIPSGAYATCPFRPGGGVNSSSSRMVSSPAGHNPHDQVRPLSGPPAPASHTVLPASPHQILSRSCASSPLQDMPPYYHHHAASHPSYHSHTNGHHPLAHSNGHHHIQHHSHHPHHPLALSSQTSDFSDSQPLNLSKKCSPPTASSSPHIKMEA